MWNPSRNPEADEDDSWEVRAFAEDTSDAMGATWPPRSYTCTFCRREFRSAQALGGHMNVHRRDRARLNQPGPSTSSVLSSFPVPPPSMNHPLLLPSRDFMASDGLWFQLYQQLPNPNISDPGSGLLSVWPYNIPPNVKYPQSPNSVDFSSQPRNLAPLYRSDQLEASSSSETSEEITRRNNIKKSKCSSYSEPAIEEHDEDEEIDLELRLGRSRRPPH